MIAGSVLERLPVIAETATPEQISTLSVAH